MRNLKVFNSTHNLFNSETHITDFGFGVGTASLAATDICKQKIISINAIETSTDAYKEYQLLKSKNQPPAKQLEHTKINFHKNSLGLFSYSLNELSKIPSFIFNFEHLIILEPSTKISSQKLIDLRKTLLQKNFNILGPCTHSESCPLDQSKTDWCHDRVYWDPPQWFLDIEEHLPVKNSSMTYSYIVASKSITANHPTDIGRVIGDLRNEKGKAKWLYCRGPDREFLSWLKKHGKAPTLNRGDLYQLSKYEKKSNELRISKNLKPE